MVLLNIDLIIFLVYGVTGFVVSLVLVIVNKVVSRVYYGHEKLSPYECGFQPSDTVEVAYDVHFYRVGILFLVFDVELIFFLPCVYCNNISFIGFVSIFVFILILVTGFIFEYVRNFLNWVQI